MKPIKIGWAKREFSENVPCNINGQMYLRICEGIHDPLYVTALCVEDGESGEMAVFTSIDVTTITGGITDEVMENLRSRKPEIPEEAIILNATHTHSSMCIYNTAEKSPDGIEIYSGAKTRARLASLAADAIIEAYETRKEGAMAYGYGYAVVAHSRRVIYSEDQSLKNPSSAAPNGKGVMYGNTNKPDFESYEAGADHFLNLMFTFDANEKLTGIVVNVPCPSQLSEHFRTLSADYWNEVREMVGKEYGEDVFVLPQCAAAGDLSPRIMHYKRAQARRMELKYNLPYNWKFMGFGPDEMNKVMGERYDIAERITDGIREVYGWAKKDIRSEVPVRHLKKTVQIHKRTVSDEEAKWCEGNLLNLEASRPDPATVTPEEYRVKCTSLNSYIGRNKRAIERNQTESPDEMMDTIVHTVQIGDIAFATNRFELYMDFMHQMQARSPFIQTFIIQLAGDERGSYLATERGVENRGYSASMFCNQASPQGGHDLVENTLEMLGEMSAKDEQ